MAAYVAAEDVPQARSRAAAATAAGLGMPSFWPHRWPRRPESAALSSNSLSPCILPSHPHSCSWAKPGLPPSVPPWPPTAPSSLATGSMAQAAPAACTSGAGPASWQPFFSFFSFLPALWQPRQSAHPALLVGLAGECRQQRHETAAIRPAPFLCSLVAVLFRVLPLPLPVPMQGSDRQGHPAGAGQGGGGSGRGAGQVCVVWHAMGWGGVGGRRGHSLARASTRCACGLLWVVVHTTAARSSATPEQMVWGTNQWASLLPHPPAEGIRLPHLNWCRRRVIYETEWQVVAAHATPQAAGGLCHCRCRCRWHC